MILAVLTYQVALIHQTQSITRRLSDINFQAAIVSLQLLRDLDQVEEFTRKLFATAGDPDYASQLEEMEDGFGQNLKELRSLPLTVAEKETIQRLSNLWEQLQQASQKRQAFAARDALRVEAALAEQLRLLGQLRLGTQRGIRATRLAIESQAVAAANASRRAEAISGLAALAALLVSLLVSFWIVRSISKPLASLTEGTQAVAGGNLAHRLAVEGKDELAQLAHDFNTMTQRLGEVDEMKKDFVSHVSHELKSPLASMQETARLLLEEIPGPLTAEQRRLLELNLQSGERLRSLIGNLLDLSRMEAGVLQYEIRLQDLGELVRTAVAEFEIQAREKGIRFEAALPEEPLWAHCDGDRVLQVMGNLLDNALKFAPAGSAIRVHLCQQGSLPPNVPGTWKGKIALPPQGEGFAVLSVSDSGPGVSAPEKENIFEKFQQGKQSKKIAGQGAGLGLAIARRIVEAHGGALWVEDQPGGGSVFCVLLAAGTVREHVPSRVSAPL